MRTCYSCKLEKELELFKKQKDKTSGRAYICKACVNLKRVQKRFPSGKGPRRTNSEYLKTRYHSDVPFKLSRLMRSRMNMALRKNQKAGSAISDLGCSIIELKAYLESKFLPGMTWKNHSRSGWHIDHIKPLAKFDLSDAEQFKAACHYTNLQPMWAKDNIRKRDKII